MTAYESLCLTEAVEFMTEATRMIKNRGEEQKIDLQQARTIASQLTQACAAANRLVGAVENRK